MNKKNETRLTWSSGIAGIAVGAFAMYFSDPDRGRRRRALVRDQVQHWAREVGCAFDVAMRDLGNRMQGVRARTRHFMSRSAPVPDVVIEERVRARLGRVSTHPRAVKVVAHEGRVNLSGAVLAHEHDDVLDAAGGTPGVAEVSDNLQTYETAEHIPSLQGSHELQQARSSFSSDNWTPATKALAALAGCTLGGYGLIRRSPSSVGLAALGLGLMLTGALGNTRSTRRMHRTGAGIAGHPRASESSTEESIFRDASDKAEAAARQQAITPEPGTLLH